ncbi:MAG: NnrU family protein [Pacificimonas sp.]
MLELAIAMALFVGTHFLMSHPLRGPMVGALGEGGFMGVYSLVSLGTLVWAARAYGDAPVEQLWIPLFWVVVAGHVVMLLASILFIGSFLTKNPALAGMDGQLETIDKPAGVTRITRHPMMWAFGLWGLSHIAMIGQLSMVVFAGGITFLALVGAAAQDAKKRQTVGASWVRWTEMTSYFPLPKWPGVAPLLAGITTYALLVWLHPLIFGVTTRLWEFII